MPKPLKQKQHDDPPPPGLYDFDPTSDDVTVLHTDSILRDPRFQVRGRLDEGIIDRYSKVFASGNEMPPIEVAKVNDSYVLLKGWHRMAALDKLGRKHVSAKIHNVGEREALWIAASANLKHGLPLKSTELREVFRKYIRARKHRNPDGALRSYREIASDLGGIKTHTTVRNWMRKDFPRIFAEYATDETPMPEGGLRPVEPEKGHKEIALESLNQTLAAYGAMGCPEDRKELISAMEDALVQMRSGGQWKPVGENPDF